MKLATALVAALSVAGTAYGVEKTAGQDFCCIVNALRAKENLEPLRWHEGFDDAADEFVEWMRMDAGGRGREPKLDNEELINESFESDGLKADGLAVYKWYDTSLENVEDSIPENKTLYSLTEKATLCGGSMESVDEGMSRYMAAIFGTAEEGEEDNSVELKCKGNRADGTLPTHSAGHINA
ncbi:hypothetical protein GGF46_004205, partial [Coemansia sp. RSA 552]